MVENLPAPVWEKAFNFGLGGVSLLALFWFIGRPLFHHLLESSKKRQEIENDRERKLNHAVEIGVQTLQKLTENGEKLADAYQGLEAVLRSEVEIAKVTRGQVESIAERIRDGGEERSAIIKAIALVENLDAVPAEIGKKLAEIRRILEFGETQ